MLSLLFAVACGSAATAVPPPAATSAPAAAAAPAATAVVAAAAPAAAVAATPRPAPFAATPAPVAQAAATPAPAAVVAPKGKRGGVIPIHNAGNVAHWSMWECGSGGTCMTMVDSVYNGLVQYNGETEDPNDIRGDLATSWKLSPDGLSYVFNLHQKARWHDGKPVTADDVVWSLNAMVDKDPPKPRAGQISPYYESSRAVDASTVEVKMKFQAAAFLPFLATEFMKILPKHQFEPGLAKDKTFMKKQENVLGSGPFKIVEHKKDVSIEYVRNDNYFKEGLPYFDGMKYFIINDNSTAIAAYKSGQVLMTSFANSNFNVREAQALGKDMEGKGRVFSVGPALWAGMLINTKAEPFTDVKVRRALNLVLQRQAFVETFGAGQYPIGAAFPPDAWFYKTDAEVKQLPAVRAAAGGAKHPDDIAEAKRLLAEAGYANGFDTAILAANFLGFPDMAQVAADQLKRFLNINATVQPAEPAAGYARYEAGDWKLGFHGSGFLIQDPDAIISGTYLKTGERNYSRWEPPEVRELFEAQARATDPAKRKAILLEMADYLMNVDSHIVVTHWSMLHPFVSNQIKNYHAPNVFPAHSTKEHLWFEPK
jgi:peptide/nickel transport system substrate-binding protein